MSDVGMDMEDLAVLTLKCVHFLKLACQRLWDCLASDVLYGRPHLRKATSVNEINGEWCDYHGEGRLVSEVEVREVVRRSERHVRPRRTVWYCALQHSVAHGL